MKRATLLPRFLVRLGGELADVIDAAMDVGVIAPVVIVHRLDDLDRFLRGCRAVQEDERLAVRPLLEDRKISTRMRATSASLRARGARPVRKRAHDESTSTDDRAVARHCTGYVRTGRIAGRRVATAGRHVEARAVARAFDLLADQFALIQRTAIVRAHVIDRIDLAVVVA